MTRGSRGSRLTRFRDAQDEALRVKSRKAFFALGVIVRSYLVGPGLSPTRPTTFSGGYEDAIVPNTFDSPSYLRILSGIERLPEQGILGSQGCRASLTPSLEPLVLPGFFSRSSTSYGYGHVLAES